MRRKRRRATSVVVNGIVHAIGAFDEGTVASNNSGWGVWGEYPLRSRRRSRAQRKADKAERLREQTNPLIRFACEALWRQAPRTHASVTCMTCLVVMARRSR